jgi:hypothetical protein
MSKEAIHEIIEKYKQSMVRDAIPVGILVGFGMMAFAVIAVFVLNTVQLPPQSGIGQLLVSIRAMHGIPPEGFPPEVAFSKTTWLKILAGGCIVAFGVAGLMVYQGFKELGKMKDQATHFPSDDSVASVSNVLFNKGGGSNREASAELLAYAGEKGAAALIKFLSSELTEFDMTSAAVAVRSLSHIVTEPAIAQLERCSLEVEALLARLLAAESDRSRHSIIRGKLKLYQESLQEALVRARRNQGAL